MISKIVQLRSMVVNIIDRLVKIEDELEPARAMLYLLLDSIEKLDQENADNDT